MLGISSGGVSVHLLSLFYFHFYLYCFRFAFISLSLSDIYQCTWPQYVRPLSVSFDSLFFFYSQLFLPSLSFLLLHVLLYSERLHGSDISRRLLLCLFHIIHCHFHFCFSVGSFHFSTHSHFQNIFLNGYLVVIFLAARCCASFTSDSSCAFFRITWEPWTSYITVVNSLILSERYICLVNRLIVSPQLDW